ncbi:hypothetical protein EV359DRAFT_66734 [Lentinula novae-zelandiae]|nr:hypothetical protein EV359DRAFT_66734 [Lentinula novae-zelandiae]
MSTPTSSTPVEHRLSWAEKAKMLPSTVPLTHQASLPSFPLPTVPPLLNDNLTWVEKGRQLPLAVPVSSRGRNLPQLGNSGWVQAGLSLPSLTLVHNAQVHLKKLLLNAHQRQLINKLYAESKSIEFLYDPNASNQQLSAETKLLALGLNPVSRNALESRWTAQYSVKWGSGIQKQRQTLFQCSGVAPEWGQEKNSKMVDDQAYYGMEMYASQGLGVDVQIQLQYNVDDWLNPKALISKLKLQKLYSIILLKQKLKIGLGYVFLQQKWTNALINMLIIRN